jgi:hypothetical protein
MIGLLRRWAGSHVYARPADVVIGDRPNPYMLRWYVIPRNRVFNVYLHLIMRSDDDRALHDHPWLNCSIVLNGGYVEHTIEAGGIERRVERLEGSVVFRRAKAAHRLEVTPGYPCMSLFITGPRIRDWGFHCPFAGWVHWQDFTAGPNGETIGKGCNQ